MQSLVFEMALRRLEDLRLAGEYIDNVLIFSEQRKRAEQELQKLPEKTFNSYLEVLKKYSTISDAEEFSLLYNYMKKHADLKLVCTWNYFLTIYHPYLSFEMPDFTLSGQPFLSAFSRAFLNSLKYFSFILGSVISPFIKSYP